MSYVHNEFKMAEVITATKTHAAILAPRLRKEDVEEIRAMNNHKPIDALLGAFTAPKAEAYASVEGIEVIGMFGVSDCQNGTDYGVPWMLTSNLIKNISKKFLRECKTWVDHLGRNYSVLYNFVHSKNKIAMRWLQWCGFDIKFQRPHGIRRETFYLFTKETKKHV